MVTVRITKVQCNNTSTYMIVLIGKESKIGSTDHFESQKLFQNALPELHIQDIEIQTQVSDESHSLKD